MVSCAHPQQIVRTASQKSTQEGSLIVETARAPASVRAGDVATGTGRGKEDDTWRSPQRFPVPLEKFLTISVSGYFHVYACLIYLCR